MTRVGLERCPVAETKCQLCGDRGFLLERTRDGEELTLVACPECTVEGRSIESTRAA